MDAVSLSLYYLLLDAAMITAGRHILPTRGLLAKLNEIFFLV